MPWKDAGKAVGLDALAAVGTWAALYTDDAATTELTGGAPAYARKAISWNAASGGSITMVGTAIFDVPAGGTVKAVAFCSAVTAGTQYVFHNVTDEAYAGQGTYSVTPASVSIIDA